MDRGQITEITTHVFGMFAVMWLSGQAAIDIPYVDVPITLQSLAAIVMPMLFGQIAVVGVFIWMIAGILGSPVFAQGSSGIDVIFSNSGGFIIGFIAVGYLATWLKKWVFNKPLLRGLIAFTGLQVLLMLIGLLWIFVGEYSQIQFESHVQPFISRIAYKECTRHINFGWN